MKDHKKVNRQIGCVCLVMVVIAAIALVLFGGPKKADAAQPAPVYATCFPAKLWSAPKSERPCHAVTRVFEDGSGTLRLGTARRAMAWCTIPNITEEAPGQGFTIRCWRKAVVK